MNLGDRGFVSRVGNFCNIFFGLGVFSGVGGAESFFGVLLEFFGEKGAWGEVDLLSVVVASAHWHSEI